MISNEIQLVLLFFLSLVFLLQRKKIFFFAKTLIPGKVIGRSRLVWSGLPKWSEASEAILRLPLPFEKLLRHPTEIVFQPAAIQQHFSAAFSFSVVL